MTQTPTQNPRDLQYAMTDHARERVGQRTALVEDELLSMLQSGRSIQLNLSKDHHEGRVYQLFFSPRDNSFFVAVTFPERRTDNPTGVVITILTAEQHEADRGPLSPSYLLRAAEIALGADGYGALRTLLLQRLDAAASLTGSPLATKPADVSVLDFMTRGDKDSLAALTYSTLLILARSLMERPERLTFKSRLRKRLRTVDLPYRKQDVKVLVNYVTPEGDRGCARLSHPSVPTDHLVDYGLENIHIHKAFWVWMARKLESAGVPMTVALTSIEVYVFDASADGEFDPVVLDLEKEILPEDGEEAAEAAA